jgi:hypothetical protein
MGEGRARGWGGGKGGEGGARLPSARDAQRTRHALVSATRVDADTEQARPDGATGGREGDGDAPLRCASVPTRH